MTNKIYFIPTKQTMSLTEVLTVLDDLELHVSECCKVSGHKFLTVRPNEVFFFRFCNEEDKTLFQLAIGDKLIQSDNEDSIVYNYYKGLGCYS